MMCKCLLRVLRHCTAFFGVLGILPGFAATVCPVLGNPPFTRHSSVRPVSVDSLAPRRRGGGSCAPNAMPRSGSPSKQGAPPPLHPCADFCTIRPTERRRGCCFEGRKMRRRSFASEGSRADCEAIERTSEAKWTQGAANAPRHFGARRGAGRRAERAAHEGWDPRNSATPQRRMGNFLSKCKGNAVQ